MSPKTIKVTYWVLNIIFCLFHVMDAGGGLAKAKAGVDAMNDGLSHIPDGFFGRAQAVRCDSAAAKQIQND